MRWNQLIILAVAFAAGTGLAGLLGAANLGVALAVGSIAFAAALFWLLMADPPHRGDDPGARRQGPWI